MKKTLVVAAVALSALASTFPAPAHARVFVNANFGGGGCCYGGYRGGYYEGYYGGYPAPYYDYPPAYYVSPPPTVVYEQAPPQVTYVTPQAQPQPMPQPQPQAASAPPPPQSSKTFTDDQGRTCKNFASIVQGTTINGMACLQPDGTWRTVGE